MVIYLGGCVELVIEKDSNGNTTRYYLRNEKGHKFELPVECIDELMNCLHGLESGAL